jgi:hypothetical protein
MTGAAGEPGSDPRLLISIFRRDQMAKQTLIIAVERDSNEPSDCDEVRILTNTGKVFTIRIDTDTAFPNEWLNIEFRLAGEKYVTQFRIGCNQ